MITVKFSEGIGEVREYALEEGTTVDQFIEVARIALDGKKLMSSNTELAGNDILEDGDILTLVAKVAGGIA